MSGSTFRVLSCESRTLEKEIPQLQEIASKVWKREEELKKSESGTGCIGPKNTA